MDASKNVQMKISMLNLAFYAKKIQKGGDNFIKLRGNESDKKTENKFSFQVRDKYNATNCTWAEIKCFYGSSIPFSKKKNLRQVKKSTSFVYLTRTICNFLRRRKAKCFLSSRKDEQS